jgi:CHASE2 domain-containing sensor protein
MRLLNIVGLDNLLERQLLAFASHTVSRSVGESMRLIYINERGNGSLGDYGDETTRQIWRKNHADLLLMLERAGVKVVAFDLVFPPTVNGMSEYNDAFVTALRDVQQRGKTRVVIGYDAATDVDLSIAAAIDVKDMALARVARQQQGEPGTRFLTSVLLAEADAFADSPGTTLARPMPMSLAVYLADRSGWPPIALTAVEPGRRRVTFSKGGDALRGITVDIRGCTKAQLNCPLPTDATRHSYAFLPVWMGEGADFVERSYASVALQPNLGADYAGKIVLIGARTPDEVVTLDPESIAGTVWGYQVHARALADLLSDSYLRRPTTSVVFLFLVALVVLGIVAQLWLPKLEVRIPLPMLGSYPIPLGLVLIAAAHGFLMIELLQRYYLLHDIGYEWLALAAGFYFASRPLQPKAAKAGK